MIYFIFLVGLSVGSFVNVLIDRLPKGEDILFGRSHCDFCKKTLRWYELVPLLSFFIQRGRCRRCKKQLSWQYPLVEVATGVGFVFFLQGQAFEARQGLALWGVMLIFISLLVIFVADFKTFIIPDSMVILGVAGALLQGRAFEAHQGSALWLSALSASSFFLFLWAITKGHGMGFGDVKLAFLLGLLLGFPQIVIALYVAFLTGAVVGVILIVGRKKSLKSHVPFGPFLIFGYVTTVLYGTQIYAFWNHFL